MAANRGANNDDKLPEINVFDGSDDGYLDADEAYQRWARRHYKGGLDQWIYGGKCPIVPSMGIGWQWCGQRQCRGRRSARW